MLRDVNLSIREHDFIGIIGPNGGGKTTLLKVILGLLKPFSGEIVYHVSKQSLFGYLPQNSRFDARFPISVKEVVLSGLMSEKGIFKDYTKADREKVDEPLCHGFPKRRRAIQPSPVYDQSSTRSTHVGHASPIGR